MSKPKRRRSARRPVHIGPELAKSFEEERDPNADTTGWNGTRMIRHRLFQGEALSWEDCVGYSPTKSYLSIVVSAMKTHGFTFVEEPVANKSGGQPTKIYELTNPDYQPPVKSAKRRKPTRPTATAPAKVSPVTPAATAPDDPKGLVERKASTLSPEDREERERIMATRRNRRRAANQRAAKERAALPAIGESLTVYSHELDEDGSVVIKVRNGKLAWTGQLVPA